MKEFKDLPSEVRWVYGIQTFPYIDIETYEKAQEIIGRYPEYFPWEHKYRSVPKEVHDAYWEELNMLNVEYNHHESEMGIQCLINEIRKKTDEPKKELQDMVADWFDEMNKEAAQMAALEDKIKRIWKKHYGIFGLKYRK